MKTLGIIGGFTYSSTGEYYINIARKVNQRLGGYHAANLIVLSADPTTVIHALHHGESSLAASSLIQYAKQLEQMGADCIIIPCNTLHKFAQEIENSISIPLLNIVESVGNYLKINQYQKVALLGTSYTIKAKFYREELSKNFNVETIIPNQDIMQRLDDIIFNEFCQGRFENLSKNYLIEVCKEFWLKEGCQAVILGCTELPILLKQSDIGIHLVDTIQVHSDYAVNYILQ